MSTANEDRRLASFLNELADAKEESERTSRAFRVDEWGAWGGWQPMDNMEVFKPSRKYHIVWEPREVWVPKECLDAPGVLAHPAYMKESLATRNGDAVRFVEAD